MKIDEASINHNVARLSSYAAEDIWDVVNDKENAEKRAIARVAYINGVNDMAEAMKEVLKA